MSAGADLSGQFVPRARGRFAEVESYLTGEPQRPLEVVDDRAERSVGDELHDVLAYFERRIGNAAAVEKSTAPDSDTRELAGDRRRQMEVIRDEIAQGMHVGMAQLLATLGEGQ